MNSDGSRIVQLTRNDTEDGAPEWSPDGQSLVFVSNRDGHYEIYGMDADGSNPRKLTTTLGHAIQPDWKPETGPALLFDVQTHSEVPVTVLRGGKVLYLTVKWNEK